MDILLNQLLDIAPIFFGIIIMLAVYLAKFFHKSVRPKTLAFILSVIVCTFGLFAGFISVDTLVQNILAIGTASIGTYEIFKKYLNA